MTINKCNKCPYIENVTTAYGDTILCCGKNNEVINVSLKDYKTLKNKCPIETDKAESKAGYE